MSFDIPLHGVVLSSMPIGESDRRIVLLTKERGLISAFARGARRQNNPLGAASSPFTFGVFRAYEGRSSYTVVSADVKKYFTEELSDLDSIYLMSYMAEVAEYYGEAGADETDRINLLYVSFMAVKKKEVPARLIRRIYEIRTLLINGEYPDMTSCICCGKSDDLLYFSINKRGLVCSDCMNKGNGDSSTVSISKSVRYAVCFILTAPLEKLYSFTLTDKAFDELDILMKRYMKRWKDHTYRTEKFL